IEIGSWLGKSTRYFAEKVGKQGKVYAIDTWLGSEQEKEHQADPRLKILYQLFLSNIIQSGFANVVIPFRMKSQEASIALNVKGDLIYIDGAHDYNSVYEDILAWNKHLNEGGILCGDDWHWKSVRDAVKTASKKLGKGLHYEDNFWWFD
ncbi:MAG: class I SAM-dependent methyltransferase, partial [Parachlamydiaceae bacterium]